MYFGRQKLRFDHLVAFVNGRGRRQRAPIADQYRLVTTCMKADGHLTGKDHGLLSASPVWKRAALPFDGPDTLTINDRTQGLLTLARHLETACEDDERS
ncbi:hypothetical protein [Micromonospora sp. RTP1Z1]|uniref:hypothetical protein n=1 Tax=Micromonospora sp. RTP1Z1 TaxID=2994043 RepID=UPI0029C6DACC|nr:hypothetical protein [Micromonospora sp. RTP1Z1]